MHAVDISLSALDVEWRRLEVIAQNLANMNTTRTGDGGSFAPLRLLSGPLSGVSSSFSALMQSSSPNAAPNAAIAASGVQVLGIEPTADGVRRVYEPTHPHADADGFVSYPNVDHAGEMTLMIRASRAYEANLAAVNMAHDMYARALDIGRQS